MISMHQIVAFMVDQPLFTLFMSLALGYALGNVKFPRGFTLGPIIGTLIVTLIIGQVGSFPQDEFLGTICFGTFMFAVGYRIGPSFITSMKMFGSRIILVSLFWLGSAFIVAWLFFKGLHIGPGVAGGTVAGALSQSTVIASTIQTIGHLSVSSELRSTYEAQVPIAYVLTYVFGTTGVIIFLRDIAPKMLHISLAEQGSKMARKYNFHEHKNQETNRRTFRLNPNSLFVGMNVKRAQTVLGNQAVIVGIQREGQVKVAFEGVLQAQDDITIMGFLPTFNSPQLAGLDEIATPNEMPQERRFILAKGFSARQLTVLQGHGIFVNPLIPPERSYQTQVAQLQVGDCVQLADNGLSTILNGLGKWQADRQKINFVVYALSLGGAALLGLIGFQLNGIPMQLGNGTAALIMGLLFSTWITRHPEHENIPLTVIDFMQSFGLTLFIATVGLKSAQAFTSAIASMGLGILMIGIAISIIPHLLTLLFGRYVLRLEPLALLGALTGVGTIATAMNEISLRAGQDGGAYFASAFPLPFVLGNIIITLFGPLFVALLA